MICIINRNFTPEHEIPGEALLELANKLSVSEKVTVIVQASQKVPAHKVAENVSIKYVRSLTDSNSALYKRIIEAVYFMAAICMKVIFIRPKKVYVATDPPILIPFCLALLSILLRFKLIYHLQDIHPESYATIRKMSALKFRILSYLDTYTLNTADHIITLSNDMVNSLKQRNLRREVNFHIIANTCVDFGPFSSTKSHDIIFAGNAGRFQNISYVTDEIRRFLELGGSLSFTFVGSGVNKHLFDTLANDYPDSCRSLDEMPLQDVMNLISDHHWGLISLNNETLKYAYPSKSAAYLMGGCGIIAICNIDSALAMWLSNEELGIAINPLPSKFLDLLGDIEKKKFLATKVPCIYPYSNEYFAEFVSDIILSSK